MSRYVEKVWLTPVVSSQFNMAAFINKYVTCHDLDDMEEEHILPFQCEEGLFKLGESQEEELWTTLPDGTPVAHDSIAKKRGT